MSSMLSEAAIAKVRAGGGLRSVISVVAKAAFGWYSSDIVLRHGPRIHRACLTIYREESERVANEAICPVCEKGFTDDEWEDRHWSSEDEDIEYHAKCCPECKGVSGG